MTKQQLKKWAEVNGVELTTNTPKKKVKSGLTKKQKKAVAKAKKRITIHRKGSSWTPQNSGMFVYFRERG